MSRRHFHGWIQEEGELWAFADIYGVRQQSDVFVINDFGSTKTPRDAVAAITAAMRQFPGRVHLQRTEKTDHLLTALIKDSELRMAPIRDAECEAYGVLGVRKAAPPKVPWWKIW